MAKPKITIIGLGDTGKSIGLALLKEPGDFEVVGHDRNTDVEADAKRLGAVERSEWNLHTAVEGASLVVLALPLQAIIETFGHIAEDLAPDALVFAINGLLRPVGDAAARLLPAHRRIVAGHPIRLSSGASAEALNNVLFCIAAPPHAEPSSVELASDLVERVGAKAHFVDAEEHDGIMAAVEQLPQVLSAALISANTRAAGWREARQLAGRRFAQASTLLGDPKTAASAIALNRDALLLRLEEVQRELAAWSKLIETSVPPAGTTDGAAQMDSSLLEALERAAEEQTHWHQQAQAQKWEPETDTQSPSGGGLLRQLFLGNIGRRRPPEERTTR